MTPEATTLAVPVKETKAQKAERLKREKNPWDALDEIRAFAREGRNSVLPEWAGTYFKWWGIYTQGDGVGAVGGVGGEGKTTEFFMMRIGLPNGLLTAQQLRVIGNLTKKYARNLADITVRQNIQLHWLTIESLPEVIDALTEVGLSPKGACGDVVRNVTGCPLAGITADEILDASPLAVEVANALTANPEFYNLPRKFKMTITGCPVWCSYPEINDVALVAVRRGPKPNPEHAQELGYSLFVGGGLSTEPHLALKLDAFIKPEQALAVVRGIAEIFRAQLGLRESRDRARLKYLFMREGWTPESFLAELEAQIGFRLEPAVDQDSSVAPDDILRDHVGIHRQRQEGLSYVGASVLRGRLSGEQLEQAADLAERYGSGELRTTVMQNLIFINIPNARTIEFARELDAIGLRVAATNFWRGAIACTGTEFCKLAISETKGFARWLVEELEERLPGFDQQLKLHVTGCPNSCGQHWIADIGIEGKKIKHEGKLVDGYYFCVGGAVGNHAAVARPVGYRIPATQVPDAIERLLQSYLYARESNENLRSYFARHSEEELRAQLAGEELVAVGRDLPSGHVPHGASE